MSEKADFQPYIDGARRLLAEDVDAHVERLQLHIAYYGEMPQGTETSFRENHPAIEVQDDSGVYKYSVLISGDLLGAKKVLVRPMSWSDHPGRGFEALREALVADPDQHLAVVGVSFPGSGFSSQRMTIKQRESLNKGRGFEYIGAQQWQAVKRAMLAELVARGMPPAAAEQKFNTYNYILAGHSQGAANSVGLFQSAPDQVKVESLGLVEDVAIEAQGWLKFRIAFLRKGMAKFPAYTKVNPYNQYPELGPDWRTQGLVKNVATRPASHIGAMAEAMRGGGDVQKVVTTMLERDVQSLAITLANGSEGLASASVAQAEAELFNKVAKVLKLSDSILAKSIVWPGHYHAAMENLANAQATFRSIAS